MISNPTNKGKTSEAVILAALVKLGQHVLIPSGESRGRAGQTSRAIGVAEARVGAGLGRRRAAQSKLGARRAVGARAMRIAATARAMPQARPSDMARSRCTASANRAPEAPVPIATPTV